MDSHQETSATDLAQSNKRKSTSTTELDTPNKRPNIDLEGGQLTKNQKPSNAPLDEAGVRAEVERLELRVYIKSHPLPRIELTRYFASWEDENHPRRTPDLWKQRSRTSSSFSKSALLPILALCATKSPRPWSIQTSTHSGKC
jgi:hypothetical protein